MTADDIDKAIQTAFQNFRADNCGMDVIWTECDGPTVGILATNS